MAAFSPPVAIHGRCRYLPIVVKRRFSEFRELHMGLKEDGTLEPAPFPSRFAKRIPRQENISGFWILLLHSAMMTHSLYLATCLISCRKCHPIIRKGLVTIATRLSLSLSTTAATGKRASLQTGQRTSFSRAAPLRCKLTSTECVLYSLRPRGLPDEYLFNLDSRSSNGAALWWS